MFAKVYSQIFDSSIAENYTVRHVFMDLLVLADADGVVDMTQAAISRRTNVPVDVLRDAMKKLSEPDPESRSEADEGRRIALIDSHRDWGWRIINYHHYRKLRDEEGRRSYYRDYMRDYRKGPVKSRKDPLSSVNIGKSELTQLTHAEGEEEAKAVKKVNLLHKAVMDSWNELGSPFPKVQRITDKRAAALRERFKDLWWSQNYEQGLERLRESDFCKGVTSNWVADFDFFIAPDSLTKILEGKYDNRTSQGNGSQPKKTPHIPNL